MEQSAFRDLFPPIMTPKAFMMILQSSLTCEKAAEDQVVESDTGITVIFVRPLEPIIGIDEQIVKLQHGLQRLSTMRRTDNEQISDRLRALFDITKGTYFRKIHDEVIRSVRRMLPLEMKDFVNINTTFSLASSIYDVMLKQMNSFFMEMDPQNERDKMSFLPVMDIAQNLLLITMKKLQDFWQICRVYGWLKASRGSPVDIHDELEATVAPLKMKVVEAIFQTLLNSSCEGTSRDTMDCDLDTPLRNFLQAVFDKIRTEISPDPVADCSDVAGTSETVMTSEGSTCHKTSFEHVERPALSSELECRMFAAASRVMSALVSKLKSTYKEALADPSVDPALYATQVQDVSDKVLKSIWAKMKEVLVADIFRKANEDMTTKDDAQLKLNLLSGSRMILNTIIDSILAIPRPTGLYRRFLKSLKRCLILHTAHLSQVCAVMCETSEDEDSIELQSQKSKRRTVRFPKIRFPKLTFKKNRIEPMSADTQDLTETEPVPAEEPSTSQAPSTSAAVPFPKRRSVFSRISAVFSRVFKKRSSPPS